MPCSFTEMGKDAEQAKQFKDDGNKAFQREEYATAVRLYSKSLLHMPGESPRGQRAGPAAAI
ncbi:SET and MYND domain-containing protein 4 [Frankliniella fusca]|uniref:SET and MYND domain-containing protein 4 n=1 Tax=Frankliniella fusca TaxID=407009 RepID=A0AAE1HFA6_9NEOP|nr:SET and MYND domain-containing protein 4 [Frankliniella fusca]